MILKTITIAMRETANWWKRKREMGNGKRKKSNILINNFIFRESLKFLNSCCHHWNYNFGRHSQILAGLVPVLSCNWFSVLLFIVLSAIFKLVIRNFEVCKVVLWIHMGKFLFIIHSFLSYELIYNHIPKQFSYIF